MGALLQVSPRQDGAPAAGKWDAPPMLLIATDLNAVGRRRYSSCEIWRIVDVGIAYDPTPNSAKILLLNKTWRAVELKHTDYTNMCLDTSLSLVAPDFGLKFLE